MKRELKPPRRISNRESAGIILYREPGAELEILLVHPSGWYNKSAPWSIPKGIPEGGESMAQAALRETLEETGVVVEEPLVSLDFVIYRGGKRVHGFCAPAPVGAEPSCASWEVDRAEFFPISEARIILHAAQKAFVNRLERHLGRSVGIA
ncbi:MAG: NUDIX domain-containing protein [Chloroflexota bacterium]